MATTPRIDAIETSVQDLKPTSQVRSYSGAGFGTPTATKIRRYSTNTVTGTAITCSGNDATNGTTYTINENGVYAMSIQDTRSGAAGGTVGISLNSSSLGTNISALGNTQILGFATNAIAGQFFSLSVTFRLVAGDVVRPHCDGNLDGVDSARFTITQVAKT